MNWARQWLEDWAVPHLCADKLGRTPVEQDRLCNPGLQENKASKHLTVKSVGVVAAGETPSLTEEFLGETQKVLECIHTYTPRNQHLKGPICL